MEIKCETCNSKNVYASDVFDVINIEENKLELKRVYECRDCHKRTQITFEGKVKIKDSKVWRYSDGSL